MHCCAYCSFRAAVPVIVGWKEVTNHQNYLTEVQQALVLWRFLSSPTGLEEEVEFLSLHGLVGTQKDI